MIARFSARPTAFATLYATTLCAFFSGSHPVLAADPEAKPGANVPLQRVVMFSSGVAFYERSGEVVDNAAIDLQFNTRDINDLLKSMVLQDLGGGKISTVSYGSKDPATRTLRTFAIDLTQNPTLADLLAQIRGEKIEIDGPAKLSGVIVGLERRTKPVGESQSVEVAFLNLLTEDGLRSVSLDAVGRIKLANPQLDAELRQALLILAQGKSNDKKAVSLNFTGQGKRPVRIGYIQESPIWKTSYRLVLADDEKPLLQGWAIIENTTEEDWKDVNLTLISGRPVSFVMDLYQPLYVNRPVVEPELFASLRPRTYDQDLASANAEFERAGAFDKQRESLDGLAKKSDNMNRARQAAPALAAAAPGRPPADEMQFRRNLGADPGGLEKSLQTAAQGGDVGEMFQYRIAGPVSLGRQKSAMLPIVNESVAAEKISLYNPQVHAKHPLNGLRLTNSTDLHLMQGPITVFEDGAYAGDAQIQDLPPKSERLLSYAMDLDVEVAPASVGLPEQLVSAKLVRGLLEVSRKYARQQTYVVKNASKKPKKVLIEYPVNAGWTLLEPQTPAEKTRDLYRFAVAAEPGKPANLLVKEEQTVSQQLLVNNLDDNTIRVYMQAPVVSQKVKDALAEVIKRKAALAQLAAKRQELDRQVKVIFDEQNRIRQNMAQLPKDSELFRRYVVKFNEQEDSVEQLRAQVQSALADEAASRDALNKYLQDLDLS